MIKRYQVGEGKESSVYVNPDKPDVVEKDHHEPLAPEILKGRLYLAKILHILLPNNVPDTHETGTKNNRTMVQRVDLDATHWALTKMNEKFKTQRKSGEPFDENEVRKFWALEDEVRTSEPYRAFNRALNDLEIYYDNAAINLSFNQSGNITYLDNFQTFLFEEETATYKRLYNPERLLQKIGALPDEPTRRRALWYLKQLERLFSEINQPKQQ